MYSTASHRADFNNIEKIPLLCCLALDNEPKIWPSFGLVSPTSANAHDDMNYETILKSSRSLHSFFKSSIDFGYHSKLSDLELFFYWRKLGVIAEEKMLISTDGINTHKGLIFLIGVYTLFWAKEFQETHKTPSNDAIFTRIYQTTHKILNNELHTAKRKKLSQSYGEWAFKKYKKRGARSILCDNFSLVRKAKRLTKNIKNKDLRYSVQRHFYAAYSEDTNLIKRAGIENYTKLQSQLQGSFSRGSVFNRDSLKTLKEVN